MYGYTLAFRNHEALCIHIHFLVKTIQHYGASAQRRDPQAPRATLRKTSRPPDGGLEPHIDNASPRIVHQNVLLDRADDDTNVLSQLPLLNDGELRLEADRARCRFPLRALQEPPVV